MKSTELKYAGNTAQIAMYHTGKEVFVGDIYDLEQKAIYATYQMFMSGNSDWTVYHFVNRYLDAKIMSFYSMMGMLYKSNQSTIKVEECGLLFIKMIWYMNKEVKNMVHSLLTRGQASFTKAFNECTFGASRMMAKKRNGGSYYKTVEASKWNGKSIKERHEIERDVKSEFIYAYLVKAEYIVDNNRKMTVKELYEAIRNCDDIIDGLNNPVWSITRTDLEYTLKKYNVQGKKAGRPRKQEAATVSDDTGLHQSTVSVEERILPEVHEAESTHDVVEAHEPPKTEDTLSDEMFDKFTEIPKIKDGIIHKANKVKSHELRLLLQEFCAENGIGFSTRLLINTEMDINILRSEVA